MQAKCAGSSVSAVTARQWHWMDGWSRGGSDSGLSRGARAAVCGSVK